jgi:hypothetical protein
MQAKKGRGMKLRGRLFSNTTYFKCIKNHVRFAEQVGVFATGCQFQRESG